MTTPTTESFPTYVKVDKVDSKFTQGQDRYLVTLLLRKEQLEDLGAIAQELRARRSGRYHALVKLLDETIADALK